MRGHIAFAMTQKGVVAGAVIERNLSRTIVFTQSGREVWGNDRVFHISDARVPMHSSDVAVNALTAFTDRVQALRVDLGTLWELLREEKEAYRAEQLAEIMFGISQPEHVAAIHIALVEDDTFFRLVEGLYRPRPLEAVESIRFKREQETREQQLIERMAMRFIELLSRGERFAQDDTAVKGAIEWLRALAITKSGDEATKGESLLKRIYGNEMYEPRLRAFEVLVRLGVFHEDEILSIHKYKIALHFPRNVLEEAERIAKSPLDMTDRTILSQGAIGPVTIDDPWTEELDDALMLEVLDGFYRVHVLIADPTAIVPMDSLTAAEGMSRAATLYLPTGKVPMLPELLSKEVLSLSPEVPRPMLDFECTLTAEGHVESFRIVPVIATVRHRLCYAEADRIIAEGTDNLSEALRTLFSLAESLRRNRVTKGAVLVERDEVSVRVESGEVVVRRLPSDSPSRRLVTEFMVLACTQAGSFARENGVPVVYRRQSPPDSLRDLDGIVPGSRAWAYRMMRLLKRAELTTQPDMHYGLGVCGYTQVTSPLRRFQDFITHIQLKGFLKTGRPPLDTGGIVNMFGDLETRGEALVQVEREAKRYWLLKYLKRFEGRTIEGEVVASSGSKGVVQLIETGLCVPLAGAGRLQIGSQVEVRVQSVDPRRDQLLLAL